MPYHNSIWNSPKAVTNTDDKTKVPDAFDLRLQEVAAKPKVITKARIKRVITLDPHTFTEIFSYVKV